MEHYEKKMSFLGENIQTIRKHRGMKQQELADKIGINMQSLSKIERGVNYPTFDTLEKIMDVLKLLQVMTGDARYKRIFGKKKEGVHSMCDVAERLEKMGWEKGQMEGKIEGKILVYKNLRREGFDEKEARRLTELPEDITLEQ